MCDVLQKYPHPLGLFTFFSNCNRKLQSISWLLTALMSLKCKKKKQCRHTASGGGGSIMLWGRFFQEASLQMIRKWMRGNLLEAIKDWEVIY